MTDIEAEETVAYRVTTGWTDEETAHRLLEAMVQAGIARDRLRVQEERVEVDTHGV